MIVLDTNHLTELQRETSGGAIRLVERLKASEDREIATTIVNAEEQLRGRLAVIRRRKSISEEIPAYDNLAGLLAFYSRWTLLHFDQIAAAVYQGFAPKLVRRIGPMDCKIAAIALAHRATLLTANLQDFQQVPGLQVEGWLRV